MIWRTGFYIQTHFNIPTSCNEVKINYDEFVIFYSFEGLQLLLNSNVYDDVTCLEVCGFAKDRKFKYLENKILNITVTVTSSK